MKEELNVKNGQSILVSFLVGGVVGAGIALLLAPKSGKELRKDIKNMASDTRDKIAATVEKGKELYIEGTTAVKNAIEAGKDVYIEGTSAVKSAIEAGKDAYVSEIEKHRKAA
jgi:gas vesicle protein